MSAKKIHNSPPHPFPSNFTISPPVLSQIRCLNPPLPPSDLAGTTTTTFLRRNHQCHHRDLLFSSPVSTTTPISYPKSSTISSNPLQSSLTLNLFCPSEPSNAAALRQDCAVNPQQQNGIAPAKGGWTMASWLRRKEEIFREEKSPPR
ncbi:hypothetical protein Adt_17586 [Abeliophyllum distichum]|uniref:Uncharacterized protein n=1 Tax=Abeliophyllum distichum TaxID=126358 RepID=A0ABD1TGX2_9LAMI